MTRKTGEPTQWMIAAVRPLGQRVVIVGSGAVARRRASMFAAHGAKVKVFDPLGDQESIWPEGVAYFHRAVTPQDLETAWLVVVATNDPEVNIQVGEWAHELGLECNRADDVDEGTFAVPALMENDEGWQLAILGGEAGPLFSTWMKGILQNVVSLPKVNHVYRALAAARTDLQRRELSQEKRAEIMRAVMAQALESDDAIDAGAIVQGLVK